MEKIFFYIFQANEKAWSNCAVLAHELALKYVLHVFILIYFDVKPDKMLILNTQIIRSSECHELLLSQIFAKKIEYLILFYQKCRMKFKMNDGMFVNIHLFYNTTGSTTKIILSLW